jgi:CheY-like chemotaxis protein
MSGRTTPPHRPERPGDSSPGSRDPPSLPGLRILAVDDSASARKIFQGVLLRLGVGLPDLRFAADAAEALLVFTQWHPDLVFVDIELRAQPPGPKSLLKTPAEAGPAGSPGYVDGDALTAQMLERNPRLQVVVVTACDPDHPRVRALMARGAIDVIVKPVLAGRVQEVLERFVPAGGGSDRSRGNSRNA